MFRHFLFAVLVFAIFLLNFQPAVAQRPRFTNTQVIPNGQAAPPVIGSQVFGQPQQPMPTIQTPVPTVQAPPLTTPQGFDPFAIQTHPLGASPTQSIQPPPIIYPQTNVYPGAVAPPPYPPPATGYSNGSWAESAIAWPSQTWARLRGSDVYRLLERPRYRHTYLGGASNERNVSLNEAEIATTLTIPCFLYSAQPLRISPGFIFHFWDGPVTQNTGADLPAQTYSTYLAFDYSTPWDRALGGEINFTIGLYTDFQHTTSNSIRLTGTGLGWFRFNNVTTFKFGVEYLDRVDIKLLPAGGFFIHPRSDLKFDIYFPRPKIAKRLPNLSNVEVWGYLGAEYGGGSWTIQRVTLVGDQVDMNDIRVFAGFEWMGPRHVTGFFEAGYVFERELVYRNTQPSPVQIDSTYMLRAGFAF